jgi:hypothetical protein
MSLAVNGWPSCHVTPSRMLKVQVSPSSDWVQSVAMPGEALRSFLSKFSSRSKFSARTSYSGVSNAFHGLTVRMSLIVPSMKVAVAAPLALGDEGVALWAQAPPAARIIVMNPLTATKSPLWTFLMVPPSVKRSGRSYVPTM